MPIYEYLCKDCNRVFQFMVHNPKTARKATCPQCEGENMKKMMSGFGIGKATRKSQADATGSGGSGAGDAGADPLDNPRAEREMMKLMSQAENMNENDPRQLGTLMRKMSDITGEPLDGEMEEAVRRLEAGEDPEKIEEDLGEFDDLDDDGMGGMGGGPTYDDNIYSL